MPLFEYACKECSLEFETLIRGTALPECPSCHSTALERRLSTFAAHTSGAVPTEYSAPTACGRCGDPRGPGACSMN